MTLRGLTRRGLIASIAAFAAHEALTAGLGGSVTPQLGGGIDSGVSDGGPLGGAYIPPPPSGSGYVYLVDTNGQNQVVYFTDTSGVSRPTTAAGGS